MDLREKIAEIVRDSACFLESLQWEDLDEEDRDMFRDDADQILTLFQDWLKEEVEKMENPFTTEPPEQGAEEWAGFEHCRLVLLDKIERMK